MTRCVLVGKLDRKTLLGLGLGLGLEIGGRAPHLEGVIMHEQQTMAMVCIWRPILTRPEGGWMSEVVYSRATHRLNSHTPEKNREERNRGVVRGCKREHPMASKSQRAFRCMAGQEGSWGIHRYPLASPHSKNPSSEVTNLAKLGRKIGDTNEG